MELPICVDVVITGSRLQGAQRGPSSCNGVGEECATPVVVGDVSNRVIGVDAGTAEPGRLRTVPGLQQFCVDPTRLLEAISTQTIWHQHQ